MSNKDTQAEIEVFIGIEASWRWDKDESGSLIEAGWRTALHQLRHEKLNAERRLEKAERLIASVRDIIPIEVQVADEPYLCECHERDSSVVCKYCYAKGERGHMQ